MPNAVLEAAGLTILATNTPLPDQPGELRFSAFPNPARSFISMEYDAPDRGIVTIRVFDPAGKTVKNLQMNCSSGRNKFLTDVTLWPPGMYLIRVDYNNYFRVVSFSEKIVIWR